MISFFYLFPRCHQLLPDGNHGSGGLKPGSLLPRRRNIRPLLFGWDRTPEDLQEAYTLSPRIFSLNIHYKNNRFCCLPCRLFHPFLFFTLSSVLHRRTKQSLHSDFPSFLLFWPFKPIVFYRTEKGCSKRSSASLSYYQRSSIPVGCLPPFCNTLIISSMYSYNETVTYFCTSSDISALSAEALITKSTSYFSDNALSLPYRIIHVTVNTCGCQETVQINLIQIVILG